MSLWCTSVTWLRHTVTWSTSHESRRERTIGLTLLIGNPVVAVIGFGLVGAGLSCVFPVVLSSAARSPDLPPSAAIAAVCTVGYFGFLLGPPMIGGLAELIGLPAALGLVVLLCILIAGLGSRAPRQHAAAPNLV